MLCLTQEQMRKLNPHLPCLSEKGFLCLVWNGDPSAFWRAAYSTTLIGILQSVEQAVLAVVRPISMPQSAVPAVHFYTILE